MKQFLLFAYAFTTLWLSGCGVLFTNVKPLDEKNDDIKFLNLSKENPKTWELLVNNSEDKADDSSDVSFQSKLTDGLISLNSACRDSLGKTGEVALEPFARELTLGMTELSENTSRPISLPHLSKQPMPAIETTVQGKMNEESVKIQTIVFRKEKCIYDIMYISRPDKFSTHLEDFRRFAESVRVP